MVLKDHFHSLGKKQNSSHFETYCKGCVSHHHDELKAAGTYDAGDFQDHGQFGVGFVAGVYRNNKDQE
jgi:hypothetical protein